MAVKFDDDFIENTIANKINKKRLASNSAFATRFVFNSTNIEFKAEFKAEFKKVGSLIWSVFDLVCV